MAINNDTVGFGEKATSATFNNLVADANNVTDNIHPQYGNSMGSYSFQPPSAGGSFTSILGFRHILNPNSLNNYKLLFATQSVAGPASENWDIKLISKIGGAITTIATAFVPTMGAASTKIETFTLDMDAQSTDDYIIRIFWNLITTNTAFSRSFNLIKNEI